MASVREALGKFTLAPQIDFDTSGTIDIPTPQTRPVTQPQVTIDPSYNPFHARHSYTEQQRPVNHWESLYEGLKNERSHSELNDGMSASLNDDLLRPEDVESCPLWQYAGKYILLPTSHGLVLINQHRAHTAVLYHQFLEQLRMTQGAMQQLLFPEVLVLPPDEMVLVNHLLPDLRAIGFDIEQLSPDSFSIQGLPAQLANQSAVLVVQDIIHNVRERGADTQTEWREQIAATMAESAAIPNGKTLSEEEMRELVTKLVELPQYQRTKKGKTIVSLLSDEEIGRRF